MSLDSAIEIGRLVAVVAMLSVAAMIATPRGRLPLALRGVYRIVKRDRGEADQVKPESVSGWRKALSFVIVLLAVVLAVAF